MSESSTEGVQAFLDAVTGGDAERVAELLEADPRLAAARDAAGVSAVLAALYRGRRDIAELVAAHRTDLDLFEASALGRTEPVEQLLRGDGTAVDARSPDGFTALHFACFFDHPETARALMERGAPVSIAADHPSGVHPIHSAVAAQSVGCLRLLLGAGAPVDVQQAGGWTALQAAAMHGRRDLALPLLDAGADPDLAADDGRTARTIARDAGHAGLLLRDA